MNCIFICIFNQTQYVDMFYLLLESIILYGNLRNTHILVYTCSQFMHMIKQHHLYREDLIVFEINDNYDNVDKACKSRLDLFSFSCINKYNKILYLDTDIIITKDINILFDLCEKDVLYALEEGQIDSNENYWGKTLFGDETDNYEDKTAFSSGVLLFNNCKKIIELFQKISEDIINRKDNSVFYDQPYIVYNAFKYNLYDNKLLKFYVVGNDKNINSDKIIHHFPGGPGKYIHKLKYMDNFLYKLKYNNLINICHYGNDDGFGRQLEGILRLLSISLNNKAKYNYYIRQTYLFKQMNNYNINNLNNYIKYGLNIIDSYIKKKLNDDFFQHKLEYNEIKYVFHSSLNVIIENEKNYKNNLYLFDGVGKDDQPLPLYFENIEDMRRSLPILRKAFVDYNQFLPLPTYSNNILNRNMVFHICLDNKENLKILDNENIYKLLYYFQHQEDIKITVHTDSDIDFTSIGIGAGAGMNNVVIMNKNTDVLQVLSDFIHADILFINNSSLSIIGHLLAKNEQEVYCPSIANHNFKHRILPKCINIKQIIEILSS